MGSNTHNFDDDNTTSAVSDRIESLAESLKISKKKNYSG